MRNTGIINVALAILLVFFITSTILIACEINALGPANTKQADITITSLISLAVLVLLIKGTSKWKKSILFIVYIFLAVELTFQALAVFGLLPRVNIYGHVPFGRVYWRKEGSGNSIMNRYGWHCRGFSSNSKNKRIILIGDSMIQAVQVKPGGNIGAVLENLIGKNNEGDHNIEILSLGLSGIGPAQYLELLKYSARHFDPSEAIIFVFLGNDFINTSYKAQHRYEPAGDYIYYFIDENGHLKIRDESIPALEKLKNELEYNHRNLFVNAFRTLKSHCMTRAVLRSLAKGVVNKIHPENTENTEENVRNELRLLGLDDFIFKKELNEDARNAIRVAEGLLGLCRQFAISRGIELRIVTVPMFTPTFFATHKSGDWSLEIGDHDFLLPERMLVDFGRENDISILPLGKYMYNDGLEAENIKDLYFFEGSGHFSPKGHEYLANAIYSSFYSK